MRIRNVCSGDRTALHALLCDVELFAAHEVRVADELIAEVLSGSTDYLVDVADEAGDTGAAPVGFVCYGHNPVTDAVYDIYWIVVAPGMQRRGIGRALLAHAEQSIRGRAGRAITIETSNRADYGPAGRLYESCGYARVAEIADFYQPGEAMRTFMKVL